MAYPSREYTLVSFYTSIVTRSIHALYGLETGLYNSETPSCEWIGSGFLEDSGERRVVYWEGE